MDFHKLPQQALDKNDFQKIPQRARDRMGHFTSNSSFLNLIIDLIWEVSEKRHDQLIYSFPILLITFSRSF